VGDVDGFAIDLDDEIGIRKHYRDGSGTCDGVEDTLGETNPTTELLLDSIRLYYQRIDTVMSKDLAISRLPPLLCLHLCRRVYNHATQEMTKIEDFVQFPLILCMDPFFGLVVDRMKDGANESRINNVRTSGKPKPTGGVFNYQLKSIVFHSGSADAGKERPNDDILCIHAPLCDVLGAASRVMLYRLAWLYLFTYSGLRALFCVLPNSKGTRIPLDAVL